jgi:hypothetical protein
MAREYVYFSCLNLGLAILQRKLKDPAEALKSRKWPFRS